MICVVLVKFSYLLKEYSWKENQQNYAAVFHAKIRYGNSEIFVSIFFQWGFSEI